MVTLTLISVGLVGYFWIKNEHERFKKEEVTLREEYLASQKNLIKNETEKVLDYIEHEKSQALIRLKQHIKKDAKDAYAVAANLYIQNKGSMPDAQIKKIIKDALRPLKCGHDKSYCFVIRADGSLILSSGLSQTETFDPYEIKTNELFRDMLNALGSSREGFYNSSRPNPDKTGDPILMVAYIVYFEPFDWLIGTGEYLGDMVADLKKEVLARIEKISFGDKGYIFAGQWDGLSLSGPAKGQNMIDITDVNGIKIVQELIRTANSGGGFVSYVMPKFDSDVTFKKLSYTMTIPEWKWYIGAGVNMDNIETVIHQRRAILHQRIKNSFLKIISILVAILFISLLIAKFVSNRIKKSFELFSAFFSKAATESVKIDSAKLTFREFESLAQAANRMLQQRNQAESALRESERDYRELVQSANSIILRMDTDGKVIFFNDYAQKFFGFSNAEILGKSVVGTIVPEKDRSGFDLALMIREIVTHPERYVSNENENLRRNGERVRVAWMNRAIYNNEGEVKEILCVGIDVTEKWQLEKRLAQAQKMEAIGTLAGGIAHDFNNILSAIMGYTELSLIDMPSDSPLRKNLQQILKAGSRAKELVQQILTFSRQHDPELQPVKISLIVNEALKLLRASLPSTIQIQHRIQSNLAVFSDPTNVHQVLMNLCTNASFAMRENGGILGVTLTDADLDAQFAKHHPGITPGKFVKLTVSDTGYGMSPAIIERIFDPFFTTKSKGEGTGMGLSVAHGIVKGQGGAITVESTPGQGSVFDVYLPAIETEVLSSKDSEEMMVTGTEKILFVDDEDFQADIGQKMLTRLGYRVTARTSSAEALEVFRQNPDEFDLVITDMTMPTMTGDVLARKLLAVRPDIPIIACTGYSEKISPEIIQEIGIKELAMKPVVMTDIAQMIRRVLDAAIAQRTHVSKAG